MSTCVCPAAACIFLSHNPDQRKAPVAIGPRDSDQVSILILLEEPVWPGHGGSLLARRDRASFWGKPSGDGSPIQSDAGDRPHCFPRARSSAIREWTVRLVRPTLS